MIVCATMPVEFGNAFRSTGQPWITQNMTWLYVITQDVWAIFLIWVCFSKYGKIKLGKDDEKPQFNDLTWFCMLFCSGIAVGFYFYGVYEPMSYYRQPAAYKGGGWDNNVRKPGFDGARADRRRPRPTPPPARAAAHAPLTLRSLAMFQTTTSAPTSQSSSRSSTGASTAGCRTSSSPSTPRSSRTGGGCR